VKVSRHEDWRFCRFVFPSIGCINCLCFCLSFLWGSEASCYSIRGNIGSAGLVVLAVFCSEADFPGMIRLELHPLNIKFEVMVYLNRLWQENPVKKDRNGRVVKQDNYHWMKDLLTFFREKRNCTARSVIMGGLTNSCG
jgi:hypothetical protein